MRTIAHISDLHFGRHSASVAEALLRSVNESRPDLIALSGDFTQRARTAQFAEARRFLDRFSQPKLLVPGNHDVPLYNVFRRFLGPFSKYDHYFGPIGRPANYFRDEEIAVLGINTARRFTRKNGRISVEQIVEMGRKFREIPSGIFKVLVTHHPLAIPSGEAAVELAGRATPALEMIKNAGVHLLLSGHHHRALSGGTAEIGDDGTILVLHAGTAISTRTRGVEGNTYNLLHIADGNVSVRLMEHAQGRFREKRLDYFFFDRGRWIRSQPVGA